MKWLVTGGAGYIGSHVIETFLKNNEEVVAYDSLLTGDAKRIFGKCNLVEGDIRNLELVKSSIVKNKIDGIINLAALKSVSNSEKDQFEYSDVNIRGVAVLLDVAIQTNIQIFLQSSTAAVYGETKSNFVRESDVLNPISTYAKTKIAAELLLNERIDSGMLKGVALRYFNVAGSSNRLLSDKSKDNLIPVTLDSLRQNRQPLIFGEDYDTPDGTCVRDYVHVDDIAAAHLEVAKAILHKPIPKAMNVGSGSGYSVKEVVKAVLSYHKSNLIPKIVDRRIGDPAFLVANVELAEEILNFKCSRNLLDIVSSSFL